MTQGISDMYWQAEARTAETKQFIRDIKRITRRKFTPEEKIRIVLEGFRRDTPIRDLCRREGRGICSTNLLISLSFSIVISSYYLGNTRF